MARYNQKMFLRGTKLSKPLGKWYNIHNMYEWWYDTISETCVNSKINQRHEVQKTRTLLKIGKEEGEGTIKQLCNPLISPRPTSDGTITSTYYQIPEVQHTPIPTTECTLVQYQPTTITTHIPSIVLAFLTKELWIVSDG